MTVRTKVSHVIYYILKIQKIRNASNYSSGLRAHSYLFFLLSAPTTLDVSRRMRRLKKLREVEWVISYQVPVLVL